MVRWEHWRGFAKVEREAAVLIDGRREEEGDESTQATHTHCTRTVLTINPLFTFSLSLSLIWRLRYRLFCAPRQRALPFFLYVLCFDDRLATRVNSVIQ